MSDSCQCHFSGQLHELDQAIYNLWRLYGYSEAYWRLEDARLQFQSYVITNKRATIHAKQ